MHTLFFMSHYLQHVLEHNEPSRGRQIQGNIFVSTQLHWRTPYMHLFVQRIQQHQTVFVDSRVQYQYTVFTPAVHLISYHYRMGPLNKN
jgi:hypothetical protein